MQDRRILYRIVSYQNSMHCRGWERLALWNVGLSCSYNVQSLDYGIAIRVSGFSDKVPVSQVSMPVRCSCCKLFLLELQLGTLVSL